MPKNLLLTLITLILSLTHPIYTLAATQDSGDAPVTATIPATTPTTTDNQPPTPPILIRIEDDSVTANPHPELVWSHSTDPDGNTIYYDLYLNGVATYLGISDTGNSAGSGYSTTIVDSEIRLIMTTDLPDGEYTWQIRAYDPAGGYGNSTTWDFTIDTTPPYFVITDIDIHHDLSLDSTDPTTVPKGTRFEVTGPKDIYFTIETEPSTTIQLSFYNANGEFIAQTSATTSSISTIIYPYVHLQPGIYLVQVVAIDHANLTSTIPTFELVVIQPTITLPLPPIPGLPPSYVIPYITPAIPSLPATIMRVSTRVNIAVALFAMLAVIIYLLLMLLKRRRYNLVLINPQGTPLKHSTIYHSKPDTRQSEHHLRTPALLTRRAPFRYPLITSDHGKAYIPHLARYSTLTIRTQDSLTILSVSRYHSPITLIIAK